MKEFITNGFIILENVVPPLQAEILKRQIKKQLEIHAQEIGVSLSDYLYCTGRWASPSKVVDDVGKEIDSALHQKLENLLERKVEIEKSNIICKNSYVRDAVPLHQDIAYSPEDPYHFSLWLALNDVCAQSGPLQFITGSHKWGIKPAVDFWSPDNKLDSSLKKKYANRLQTIQLKQGDAVTFDSRLWHGSIKSYKGYDRYAYVSRWKFHGHLFPRIPKIKPCNFGMWNCHQMTNDILWKGLQLLNSNTVEDSNFLELLSTWKNLLMKNPNLIIGIDPKKAWHALECVRILHMATGKYYAGDLTGKIYRNLLTSLLEPIKSSFGKYGVGS
ncbi:MAG: hypothetical protein K0R73_986 [Candidatus Midichloriaceae bacterium]|jgi:ectoine hydroxylase-related dioxygenase (phytanoyl-CoA dioxygenase family)|nr:hypothetical protein [Candidatus Midichloriaceae bacterium]